ncbi:MAG TPA: alpha/beta hydrolase [Bordetella sp.]|nr:alpha/beta hydrolase [Bordetella sp.]
MVAIGGMASVLSLLAGCASIDRNEHADAMARAAGLTRELVHTDAFVLTAYARIGDPAQPLDIYFEGDGYAWISPDQPALDPTPYVALGLALAAADPAPNVVYLARPCQFTPIAMNPRCGVPYWTGRRYAPEVVASTNQAVSVFASRAPEQGVNLIGYSGGGALAVLVAAARSDTLSIRTIAGNLDHAYVNHLHDVSPMPDSLNPIDSATRVAAIPQIHFSGADDTVVPAQVARRFAAAAGSRCSQVRIEPDMAHDGLWNRLWPTLLRDVPVCGP